MADETPKNEKPADEAADFDISAELDQALDSDNSTGPESGSSSSGSELTSVGAESMDKMDFSKLKMILDVPLKVSVELGRTKMLINDLLQLGQGSVVELDKIAGEPMEILVNDKLVAMGEVVVVNEKFGVRLTEVISQFGINDFAKESEKSA